MPAGVQGELAAPVARGQSQQHRPAARSRQLDPAQGQQVVEAQPGPCPGQLDPDRETLKIDYDYDENPRLLIRDILDELVQIVPGAYLGKVLLRRKETWRLLGYFALQPAAASAPRHEQPVATRGEPVPTPA